VGCGQEARVRVGVMLRAVVESRVRFETRVMIEA
jgi:hypothetical protein